MCLYNMDFYFYFILLVVAFFFYAGDTGPLVLDFTVKKHNCDSASRWALDLYSF